jgi:hypothetical protein
MNSTQTPARSLLARPQQSSFREVRFEIQPFPPDRSCASHAVRDAQEPEFDAWRWERLDILFAIVVPFKRDVYVPMADAFSSLAVSSSAAQTRQSGCGF